MKRGDSKLEKMTDTEPYNPYPMYHNQNAQYPQPQTQQALVPDTEFSSINVGVGEMESGLIEPPKSLMGRLWQSYSPTVSGLSQNLATKMENLGEYVCDTIGITRPKYEWEVNEYFQRQQGSV